MWKAYVTVQEHPGGLYHPPLQWRFALFALYEGIIMHKIVLAWQFESMLRDCAVFWQEVVGINGETAVLGDEHPHLWMERGAHQESDPLW